MKLTQRDQDIIQTMAAHVRILSLEQIAEQWWPNAKSGKLLARRRLTALAQLRLVTSIDLLAARLPDLKAPVLTWHPGLPEPDLGAAAWQLQSRWTEEPTTTKVYLATSAAARLFGGKANGKLKHHFQASHDLGVSAMYLRLRRDRPDLIRFWIGEDVLAPQRRGEKLPDAILATSLRAVPTLVLEFGGAYDKHRLIAFHQDCQLRALPYEVW